MNWTLQILAFLPNCLGALGAWLAGSKRRVGWSVLLVSEAAWVVLAVYADLWSTLPWCVVWSVIYWRNWKRWSSVMSASVPSDTGSTPAGTAGPS